MFSNSQGACRHDDSRAFAKLSSLLDSRGARQFSQKITDLEMAFAKKRYTDASRCSQEVRKRTNIRTGVSARADAAATHQSVVTVMDVVGQLGFVKLNLATVTPPDA